MDWSALVLVCLVVVAIVAIPRAETFCVVAPSTHGAIFEDNWDTYNERVRGSIGSDGLLNTSNIPQDTGSPFYSR